MGKITRPVKAVSLITSFTFFSFLLLSASNSTPTEPIIPEKKSDDLAIATDVAMDTSHPDISLSSPASNSLLGSEETACIVTAPGDINENSNFDGPGDCSAILNDIGTATAVGCTDLVAYPFVDGTQIDPTTYAFEVGTTVVNWIATDAITGEPITDIQLVVITDNEGPAVNTKPFIIELNDSGKASILPSDINDGSTDNCVIDSMSVSPSSFDCSQIGKHTITLTVTDVKGNSSKATATVTVVDIIDPSLVVQDQTVYLDSNGNASITAADIDNGSTDNCDISKTLDKTTFTCEDLGPNTVNFIVTDSNGTPFTTTAIVTVVDNIDPNLVVQDQIIYLDSNGNASITAADVDNGSNDNCDISMVLDKTIFTCADLGPNTVNFTVTDSNGIPFTTTATVTVVDNIDPNLVVQDQTVYLDSNGNASITAADVDNGSNDNCDISMALDKTTFTCADLGPNTVNFTVTDSNGIPFTKTATVTVVDNIDPTITAPTDILNAKTGNDGPGNCGTTVSLGTPTVGDNCMVRSVKAFVGTTEIAPLSYSFPAGTTVVRWQVTDQNNNLVSDTQKVTVTDNEKPTLTVPADRTFSADHGSCSATGVDFGNATATDNCTSSSFITITNNAPASFPIGETVVTWWAEDQTGNMAEAFQTVTIEDNELPTITAPGNITGIVTSADNDPGDCFASADLGSPVVSDNCGQLEIKAFVNGSPINPNTHLFPKGITIVTWEVIDNNENKATATQTVEVFDDEAPTIESPNKVVAYTSQNGTGDCATTAMIGFPDVQDNCNAVTIKAYIGNMEINPDLYEFPLGETTVRWVATDASNNMNDASQIVEVIDDEDPIPGDLTSITWGCELTVPLPEVQDNCDNLITVTANRSRTFTETGTIVWTFTDDRGNSTTASQEITISYLGVEVKTKRTSIYGVNDGKAIATPSGGVAPYTYEWRKSGTSTIVSTAKEANFLEAGNYELSVKDVNGCEVIKDVEIINAVYPAHIATSTCMDVHDYIRTSTFEIELNKIVGGIGDPANFSYEWEFGVGASPSTAFGIEEHTVTWDSQGDRVVYLTITDESGYTQRFPIDHYVGGCFEGCGETENFDMNPDNFFIGDAEGNPLTGANCSETTEKYMWVEVTDNANGYSLSAEMNYSTSNGEETVARKAIGCFAEQVAVDRQGDPIYAQIPIGMFRLFKVEETHTSTDMITWKCGDTFKVEGINIRWTNQDNWGCNAGNMPMCYGPETEVIVKTPLVVDATPQDVLCMGKATGVIEVHAAGGQEPYTYSLTGPENRTYQDSRFFYNLPAGTYEYSVKDANYIVSTGTLTISEPASEVRAAVTVQDPITCYGGTGSAIATGSGGVGTSPEDYTYSWSSGATGRIAEGLLAGIAYTVTVTDANGCPKTEEITLTQPDPLTRASAGPDGSFGCGITSTTLGANSPADGEKGNWTILSGAGGEIVSTELNNPNAPFTGESGEKYELQWTISKSDGSCANTGDTVIITFAEKCSTLDFDGIDDHVVIGDTYGFTDTDFTLEAWVRPESVNGTKTILSKRNTGDMGSGGYDLNINNGAISFRWNNNLVYTTSKVGTDRWYHVAVIFSGGVPEIYVDGISLPLQYGPSIQENPKPISHPFMIGGANYEYTPDRPKSLFHGWIEEVRLWKTALSVEQLRFMMNQRIEKAADGLHVKGEILPMNVPGYLEWSSLEGYYRLKVNEIDAVMGTTPDMAPNKALGYLRNIEEEQENSAPLPYISNQDGNWWDVNSWLYPDYWDAPNSTGINGEKIDWNIAWVTHDLNSGNRDIKLLGLLLKSGKLDMLGMNQTSVAQAGTGNGLTVTKYLDLDGFIDLNGESQLVQPMGSLLAGSGRLDRDQQGTGSSYNYNYFSSPVSTLGTAPNSGYSIKSVLRSGTDPTNPGTITFNYQYHFADGPLSNPLKISSYWLYKFHGIAGQYNQWHYIGENGHLEAGEGYTMKGSSGYLDILDLQNYVFTGMPNNGPITFNIGPGENRLIGNPYPSAIDAKKFIEQNLKDENGNYIFNGTLYFWSHFNKTTHYLTQYEGGYAMYNLMGSARAVANDARINATGAIGGMEPQQYIPPGQAFFINTAEDEEVPNDTYKLPLPVGMTGGEISFSNSQRVFKKEDPSQSVFHSKEKPQMESQKKSSADTTEKDSRKKIWLKSRSPLGYHRQLMVGADKNTTLHFDPGYDAPLHDMVEEDMYWDMDQIELVIQGVPDFNKEIELPLGIKIKHEGEFTIEIDNLENIPDDFAILLKDTLVGQLHDLRESGFKFTAAPGIIHGRFSVVFLNQKQEPEEILEEESKIAPVELVYARDEKAVTIYNPDRIQVIKASLYNLNGQHLRNYGYVPTEELVKLAIPVETPGIYVLRLETARGITPLKFIIN